MRVAGDDAIGLAINGAGKQEIVVAIRPDGFFARDAENEDGKRTQKVKKNICIFSGFRIFAGDVPA